MKVDITNFTLYDDYRQDVGDISSLAHSIGNIGLLHPIHVDKDFNILEGRRRFRAMKEYLKFPELEEGVHFVFSGSATVGTSRSLQIQWEENIQRKDFTPKEAADLLMQLHSKLMQENKDWTQAKTSGMIGKSKGYVSKLLYIAKNKEVISDGDTIKDALIKLNKNRAKTVLNKIRQYKVDKIEEITIRDNRYDIFKKRYLNKDCLEGIKDIEDNSIDFIYTDPPYGIDLDDNLEGGVNYSVYNDGAENITKIIRKMAPEWYRVAKKDSFIALWTGFNNSGIMSTILSNAGFKMKGVPLVWVKNNTQGISRDMRTGIGSITEYIIYGYKGSPLLQKRLSSNVLYYPTIKKDRIHVAQKSEALHKAILQIFTSPDQTVLDSFAGSGSINRACIDMKMEATGFEIDKNNYNNAITYTYDYYNKK